jgi:hypothetical protein
MRPMGIKKSEIPLPGLTINQRQAINWGLNGDTYHFSKFDQEKPIERLKCGFYTIHRGPP